MIPTTALAAGTVVAIDLAGFASGFGGEPEIDISREATLHLDTEPWQISESSSFATPVRSLWQTDALAIRVILRVAFAMRGTGLVQAVESATWA